MPLAALKILVPSDPQIDEVNGVIKGCRLAEVNRTAKFAGTDGKMYEADIKPETIEALMDLAQNKTDGKLDAHWTHDRFERDDDLDFLSDTVGYWSNFRKDEPGNLIADIALEPGQYRDRILWKARNHPGGIMCSLVFDYTGPKDDIKPCVIYSADFVKEGAATTALLARLSAQKPNAKLMLSPEDKAEIATMIADAIKGIVPATDPAAALPATFAAFKTEVEGKLAKLDTIKDEAVTAAMAKFASQVGTHGKGNLNEGKGKEGEETWDTAIAAQLTAGAPSKAVAILRIKKDKPALYNARMASNPNA